MTTIELSDGELHYLRELINNRIKDTKIRLKLYSRTRHKHNRDSDEGELATLADLQKKLGTELRHATTEKQMCP